MSENVPDSNQVQSYAILGDPHSVAEHRSFDIVATCYESISQVYSLGQIRAAKLSQLKWLKPADEVLFLGCGCGCEVVEASRRGCQVTAVDTSAKMIAKLAHRLARERLQGNLFCGRFQDLKATARFEPHDFDAVAGNFFFNCFRDSVMRELLTQAVDYVRPGGRVLIADVAPPAGSRASRCVNRLYLHAAMLPFWLLRMMDWHENHDYVPVLEELGFTLESITEFKFAQVGPVVFRNLCARRAA